MKVEVKEINLAKEGILMPCAPDVCQECAVKHDQKMPHNLESLYYQYKFYQANGRWPGWLDAMTHCSDDIQVAWKDALRKREVMI